MVDNDRARQRNCPCNRPDRIGLYSTLKLLAQESVYVSTREDPIEMVVDSFNQSQIQPAIGYDFAGGIRALMR